MATKEELLKLVKDKRTYYENWHKQLSILYPPKEQKGIWLDLVENHRLRLTTLQISLSLFHYEVIIQSPEFKQRHQEKIESFLEELNECPTKEPEKHLRYKGYYS